MTDHETRLTVLDTSRSFIVQAPAGSGKTELLIQRYLALLAIVELPEQIVAITFTRKAAAEMRARILEAVRAAHADLPPEQAHEARTRNLARAVLARDRTRHWGLLDQPQRLRIDTLDALNVWLAQRLPVLSGGVAGARIEDDAREYYRQAAQRTLGELSAPGELGQHLRTLLQRLDNGLSRLESLLAEMLPRRDQWLRYLAVPGETELRKTLEQALERLVLEHLQTLGSALSNDVSSELAALASHSAQYATDDALRGRLEPWSERTHMPEADAAYLEIWQGIAHLLLNRDGSWRRKVTAKHGFGPAHPDTRARMEGLLAGLRDDETLRQVLLAVRQLPAPHYDPVQWHVLAALREVLRHLAAELRLVFAERNVVDFVELALAAQSALGHVDEPSELLLALDQRVQHLLVDEFQDTSHTQLRLLELLTAGWEPEDGRTLFLVGDPMQSIYRFRDANMSLFLKVKDRGLGTVSLEPLELTRNFRSAPDVVGWINGAFPDIFPAQDDLGSGAARFHACDATRNQAARQGVDIHALRDDDPRAELKRVMEILADELTVDRASIAILVQSRSHLVGLHEQLRARGLQVHAVEIDAPNQFQVVQDLIGLTRALTHLGDRIAWLGVLRAPWCGLAWQDLHALCWDEPRRTIWELMNDPDRFTGLDDDAQGRLIRARAVLQAAFSCRVEQPLARWIERTWVSLGGPACLDFPEELNQADRFFGRLEQFASRGDLDDPTILDALCSEPQGQGDPPRQTGIEIMTIHRAKGLEFDAVVLLGLGREPRPEDPKALYWLERVASDGRDDLLMAPMTGHTREEEALTAFVKDAERTRDRAERARLLYVATTRARDRLHLVTQLAPDAERPPGRSLASWLWPQLAPAFKSAEPSRSESLSADEAIQPVLRRLTTGYDPGLQLAARAPEPAVAPPEFLWAGQAAIHVGTVVHSWLQRIADEAVDAWTGERLEDLAGRFRGELELMGVEKEELDDATERVVRALRGAMEDPRGRWVIGSHPEAQSEFPITVRGPDGLEHVRLDRTFVEAGTRWIIDFKTSEHEGGATEAFLDSEVERYRPQLARYANVVASFDERPIRVGLYFPLLKAFRDWSPTDDPS